MKKIMTIIVCTLILILGVYIFNEKYDKYNKNKAVQALKSEVMDIKTVKAGNGFEDLMHLKDILKDKKIVAMGEATHGTKEFFQMKHRMLEFLVNEMGYNVFAIEAGMSDCMAINNYILYGSGDAKKVVAEMGFWTWNTREVVDMVEWMRGYNKTHSNKVKFYGFDMQSTSTAASKVKAYLENVDASYENKIDNALLIFQNPKVFDEHNGNLPIDEINNIISTFENNKEDYINKSSKDEYELNKQNLKIICEAYDMLNGDQTYYERATKREKYMAENIKWISDFEGEDSKLMVWAHNLHVSKASYHLGYGDIDNVKEDNVKEMGSNLYDIFKDKLYVIGFQFNQGTVTAVDESVNIGKDVNRIPKTCILNQAKGESIPYYLSKIGSLYFLDFKTSEVNKDIKDLLSSPQICRYVDANFNGDDKSYKTYILDECYDGLIFIDTTSNSELI